MIKDVPVTERHYASILLVMNYNKGELYSFEFIRFERGKAFVTKEEEQKIENSMNKHGVQETQAKIFGLASADGEHDSNQNLSKKQHVPI